MIVTDENGNVCVRIGKAAPVRTDEPVPDLQVVAVADTHGSQQADAEHLHEGLLSTLPGGTYDRLFALMAQRKASVLGVLHRRMDEYVNEFGAGEQR